MKTTVLFRDPNNHPVIELRKMGYFTGFDMYRQRPDNPAKMFFVRSFLGRDEAGTYVKEHPELIAGAAVMAHG